MVFVSHTPITAEFDGLGKVEFEAVWSAPAPNAPGACRSGGFPRTVRGLSAVLSAEGLRA
ncbi:hypothetical protein GCM10010361_67220 [Streptomyces olivaceiscleroticus]|uniref:Uncharacterized protein n=1 Tax=Streptomyces olivaceiscleroticus TaxID=68245 RepID=A0ABN1B8M3_9ACTN